MGILDAPAIAKDSTGRRLASFEAVGIRRGHELPTSPFGRLMATLDQGQVSVGLTVQGDSTGKTAGKTRWPEIVAPWLAAQYPGYATQIVNWNATSLTYDPPVVLSGTPSARGTTINGSGSNTHLVHAGYGTNLTGDVEVRVRVAFPTVPLTAAGTLAARWGITTSTTTTGAQAWALSIQTSGAVSFQWSADGTTTAFTFTTGSSIPLVANQVYVVRAVFTTANGNVSVYYSADDGTTWTNLGGMPGLGTTSTIYNATTAPYTMGGYAQNAGHINATFYGLEVHDGTVTGPSVVPYYPDNYASLQTTATQPALTYAGKPVLTIVNGSWPGAALSHFTTPTNVPKLFQVWHSPAAIILSLSHNDGVLTGAPYLQTWDTWLTLMRARAAYVPFAITTQNPKISGIAAFVQAHAIRRRELLAWAYLNRVSVIDTWQAFEKSATPLTTLVDTIDGIHPSDGTAGDITKGSPLWAEVVKAALRGSDYNALLG